MRISALITCLGLGLSTALLSGCLIDASCFPAGGDKLLRATSAVAERVPVQFEYLADYDCEDGGHRFVLLTLIEKPGSLEALTDICEFWPDKDRLGGDHYRYKIEKLEFSVLSSDPGFPQVAETIDVQIST